MNRLDARLGAAVAALLITLGSGIPIARAAQSHAQVTLHMWGWADRNLCAQDYEKAHRGVKVAYTEVLDYITKLNVLRRAGGSGMPDVYFGDVEEAANLYHLGLTTDLSQIVPSSVKARYAPGTLGLVTFGGKRVALPHDMAAIGIWYNIKTMRAAHLQVPTSYDEIFADAAKLATTTKYAISWFGVDGNALETLGWAYHAKWFTRNSDGSWTVNIDSPLTEKLAAKYVAAVRSGGVLPDDPFGPVSGKAYAQHRVAFAVSANWLGHYGIEPGYPKQKKEWDFAASLPSVGWWGGGLFAVPPQSTHQAEAQQLALYCSTSPTFQHQTGTVPAYTGVWKTAGAFIPDSFWADPSEVVRQLRLSAQHTGSGWTISPNMPYVDTQAGAAVKSMVNGTPVHAALQKLQSQVVENLKLTGITVR